MNAEKYRKLVAECKSLSDSKFLAVPGLSFSSGPGEKENLAGLAIAPNRFPLSDSVRRLFGEMRLGGYGNPGLVVVHPSLNTWDPYRIRFWNSIAVHTYQGTELIDEATKLYRSLMSDDYYGYPVVVNFVSSVEELRRTLKDGRVYKTYFRARGLGKWSWGIANSFVSNGPLIKDFHFIFPNPPRRPGNHLYQGERVKLKLEVESKAKLREIRIYKGKFLWRIFYPEKNSFLLSFPFLHDQAARYRVEVEDTQGKRAISFAPWIINREFTGEMCNDNQNNIIAGIILKDDYPIDHLLVGVWHTGGGGARLGFLRPSKQITPPGKETGVTSAIWEMSNLPSFYTTGLDWKRFDKIGFWIKVKPPFNTGPRWNNKGKWNNFHALFVQPKTENWVYFLKDISSLPRDGVQSFWWYFPTRKGKNYRVWLDDISLFSSARGEKYLIDNFENDFKNWRDLSGWNELSLSREAKEGNYSLKVRVKGVRNSPTNAMGWIVPRKISAPRNEPPKLIRILSTNEVNVFKYETKTQISESEAIFTLFKPRVEGWNMVFVESVLRGKKDLRLSSTHFPQIEFASVLSKKGLGRWRKFSYVNEKGERVTGDVPEKGVALEWTNLGKKGFVALWPHPSGSFGFLWREKIPVVAKVLNAWGGQQIKLGIERPGAVLRKGRALKIGYAFLLGNGKARGDSELTLAFDIYGFDGKPACDLNMKWGNLKEEIYSPLLEAENFYTRFSLTSPQLPNPLGIRISPLNPHWDAGVWDFEKNVLLKRIAIDKENTGYFLLDSGKEWDVFAGNPVIASDPQVIINLMKLGREGIHLLVHNPAGVRLRVEVRISPGLEEVIKWRKELILSPGEVKEIKEG